MENLLGHAADLGSRERAMDMPRNVAYFINDYERLRLGLSGCSGSVVDFVLEAR